MKKIIYISLLALIACNGSQTSKKDEDTATSGTITIAADEGLQPIVDAELEVFQNIYPAAHIQVIYTSEYEAIELLCMDSARLAIVTRDLLPAEKRYFEEARITPRYSPFAKDGVALIMNNKRNDTILSLEQLRNILNGTFTDWKQINPSLPSAPIRLVFDNGKSGLARYCKDSVLNGKELGKNAYAVSKNAEVIAQVESDLNTIGLIASAWISDIDDSLARSFTDRVRIVSLIPKDPENSEAPTMKPYQAYIALKQYPLWRNVQLISREARVGLGTGFASFIASDRGQRIVLKSGLVPAQAPIRLIQLNNE